MTGCREGGKLTHTILSVERSALRIGNKERKCLTKYGMPLFVIPTIGGI